MVMRGFGGDGGLDCGESEDNRHSPKVFACA